MSLGSWLKEYFHETALQAEILAHELGHNFGLNHNPTGVDDPCSCPSGEHCVMDAPGPSNVAATMFTDCQKTALKSFMEHGKKKLKIITSTV